MSKKILMATMGLDIGGAETHIVELSKELKRRGYDIIIASNGGIYEQEILAAGIRHYTVPMHNRNVKNLYKSLVLMRKIIMKEKPDIVHAHARIPAFICGILHKFMKFRFVTTAHWVFDSSGILRYLTNWGERTIAVSDDIKEYLERNYSVASENIYVTINGIDTDKFSPVVSGNKLISELGLNHRKPIVVHVSRLDEDRAMAAERLIQIAPILSWEVDGIQIVIAGGGGRFEELRMKADAANAQIGRKCIYMLGARSDISDIVAAADLFVGVSRAALEAMAAEKLTILAGNEGYAGLFLPEKLNSCRETNFCCRECGPIDNDQFADDIRSALSLPLDKKEQLGRFYREMIFRYYSVSKMAGDYITVYYTLKNPDRKIVLSGYYGFSNSGDEAILYTIVDFLKEKCPDSEIIVLSKNPEKTMYTYQCNAVNRFSIREVHKVLKKCDILISGGGSLLQDRTSTRSLLYYALIVYYAELKKKKVMIYANGIGPVNKTMNRKIVAHIISKADEVTLRDEESLEELRNMGVWREDIHVTSDPVFRLEEAPDQRINEIFQEKGIPTDKPIVMVAIRDWENLKGFARKVAMLCDYIYNKYDYNIVFLAMQVPDDVVISQKAKGYMKNPAYILEDALNSQELAGIIGKAHFLIAMRLHALIISAKMNVPFVGIVYDPKVEYYLKTLQMHKAGTAESFDYIEAASVVSAVLDNIDAYKKHLAARTEKLGDLADENTRYLLELINKDK